MTRLGVVFTADRPPEALPAFAASADAAGLDELWLWEDCFLTGGIAAAATALATTSRITVGLGVMPAVFRNPVATAMEIATLARLHPGRFIAGLGHGVPAWMEQIGALPDRPVQALEAIAVAVRRLLAGELVTAEGDHVKLRGAQLGLPPTDAPQVLLGVRRPLGLRASGRSADGTILAEPASPAYIAWARERIDEGRASAGRLDPHRLTVFVKGRIDADRSHAREAAARMLLDESLTVQFAPLDREEEIAHLRALGHPAAVARELPDSLLDELTASGSAVEVAASLSAIAACGVESVAFVPLGPDPDAQVRLLARTVAPAVRA